ncbi:hypothetical protein PsorP6_008412 [Peronosclerospora sorghi]|uniref:Uncharacterized protein n=1 Tax=Peronosclerospora sorghi TaxID=230839 RepID=A0ACC0W9A6_9STRA|nr:hypothetical protein PsorP6_008412 [Peronosclerospora sorghi]
MCRPIESRDSLSAMGPAAVALFAGYQPPSGNDNDKALTSQNIKANGKSSFSTMAWGSTVPRTDLLSMGLPNDQFAVVPPPLDVKSMKTQADFDAQELEELLEFSVPGDVNSERKDKPDVGNLDDGFDGTEMSILYSFLVDVPEDKHQEAVELDGGILNLNVLAESPIERLMDALVADPVDSESVMSLRYDEAHMASTKSVTNCGEMKNRRLCKSERCYKRSRSNGLCISHGGGRRCAVEGCEKSSQGGNLCIRHGGGKRCSHEGCGKAAQSNFLCKAHGGGPRCQFAGCSRSSQGGGYCRSHGGGSTDVIKARSEAIFARFTVGPVYVRCLTACVTTAVEVCAPLTVGENAAPCMGALNRADVKAYVLHTYANRRRIRILRCYDAHSCRAYKLPELLHLALLSFLRCFICSRRFRERRGCNNFPRELPSYLMLLEMSL